MKLLDLMVKHMIEAEGTTKAQIIAAVESVLIKSGALKRSRTISIWRRFTLKKRRRN